MSTRIIKESKRRNYSVVRFCAGLGKTKYQITQPYEQPDLNHNNDINHYYGFVQLSKKELEFILKKIEEEEEEKDG